MVLVCSGLQSGATTAELSELLQSRRYVLLERLSSERPGRELLQALREAPIDELEEHGAWLQCKLQAYAFNVTAIYTCPGMHRNDLRKSRICLYAYAHYLLTWHHPHSCRLRSPASVLSEQSL